MTSQLHRILLSIVEFVTVHTLPFDNRPHTAKTKKVSFEWKILSIDWSNSAPLLDPTLPLHIETLPCTSLSLNPWMVLHHDELSYHETKFHPLLENVPFVERLRHHGNKKVGLSPPLIQHQGAKTIGMFRIIMHRKLGICTFIP